MKRNFYRSRSFFKNPCDVCLGIASYLEVTYKVTSFQHVVAILIKS
ncbi:hypothetical protein M153_20400011038 [Pseudoloma neurophilia]|uniref:Uncharacterized protein n=1 Tax=Pseudoloma neurophilia TaxID=146866 RepID=A0A0R0LZ23_9MICR|nr:hypothetical protein M153_20400011038 [Pseudoloma neurophilia]